ncbi:hypothetical protein MNBD_CHLOROFLEXI01-1809 [hydrothermal vent metagenome]|uniref:Short-chain dehydrogenase/reductase (SDR) superfamily n=1 Tax=hydrothermal vent metagenome TaxID=652676 RepID=A0A3B0VSI6_9ZZZZ
MRKILITGANRGIGLELTRQFLAHGDFVIATCRQPVKAAELHILAETFADQLMIQQLDVTNDDSVAVAKTAVSHKIKSLDIIINNAGILYGDETFTNFDPKKMQHTFDVNVVGTMRVVTQFIELLRLGNSAKIINISSQLGSLIENERDTGHYSYNSSKAALNMVTRKLVYDTKEDNITVISMHPGWVQTDMGGASATLQTPESAQGIMDVMSRLTLADSGKFYVYSGEEHPW